MRSEVIICPRCKPIGTKVTTVDGRRLGFLPESLYVGYLAAYRGLYKMPPKICPNCGVALEMKRQGQALVEFALIVPMLLFIILGATEVGFLLIYKAHQDRATAVVAEWIAEHPGESWAGLVSAELSACDVEVTNPMAGVVEAISRCQYRPAVLVGFPLFSGLPVGSRETATMRQTISPPLPEPSPSPAASLSS